MKGITPYHDEDGNLNFNITKVTDKVWRASLAKWKYLQNDSGDFIIPACSFCEVEPTGCENKNCPLSSRGSKGELLCAGGTYDKWDKLTDKGERRIAAKEVYDYIAKQYAIWKKKQAQHGK